MRHVCMTTGRGRTLLCQPKRLEGPFRYDDGSSIEPVHVIARHRGIRSNCSRSSDTLHVRWHQQSTTFHRRLW